MAKIDFSIQEERDRYRHSTSHIMAQAVKRLWPEAKLAIGPAIENGFYYDFDLEHKFTDEDPSGYYKRNEENHQGCLSY